MSKKSVPEFFHSYSSDFNAIYGNENTFFNRVINRLFRKSMRLRYVKSLEGCEPVEGKSVLDVGCGPGHYSIALASRGASSVLGIDFAEGMIDLALRNAARAGVEDRCKFVTADFMSYPLADRFDYSIVMGFMDYIAEPQKVVDKVLSVTRLKAFFSFPADGGVLAWQRRLRYRSRCDLFMYRPQALESLFGKKRFGEVRVERISRDYFVAVSSQ